MHRRPDPWPWKAGSFTVKPLVIGCIFSGEHLLCARLRQYRWGRGIGGGTGCSSAGFGRAGGLDSSGPMGFCRDACSAGVKTITWITCLPTMIGSESAGAQAEAASTRSWDSSALAWPSSWERPIPDSVTSLSPERLGARALYEDFYWRGATCRIKEQQLDLFADRTSATMRANQLRLYLSSAAYMLMHALVAGLKQSGFA